MQRGVIYDNISNRKNRLGCVPTIRESCHGNSHFGQNIGTVIGRFVVLDPAFRFLFFFFQCLNLQRDWLCCCVTNLSLVGVDVVGFFFHLFVLLFLFLFQLIK